MNKIKVSGKMLADELGRERIFNGINLCDKSIYTPGKQGYDEEEIDALLKRFRDDGLNLIRLGFTWAKIEPTQGKYNDEYIDNLAMLLDKCEKYGIYVYLDMHQDLFSAVCGADGAPEWATLTDGHKIKKQKFVWAEPYFWGKFCHAAFDNFWANKEVNGKGLQDSYADMWKYVVTKLSKKPAVIGYDMMNEPYPGADGGKVFRSIVKNSIKTLLFGREIKRTRLIADLFKKDRIPLILNQLTYDVIRKVTSPSDDIVRRFDRDRYAPFLNKTAEAISEADSEKIFFIENCYYSNLGIPCSTPEISIKGKRIPNQLFAPHAYDFAVDTPLYKYASNERISGIFGEHKRTQDRLGVPVVVGEWGGSGGSDNSDWIPHISFLLDLFDKNKWSNTYWAYYDGFLDTPVMNVLRRPYPRAVAGTINDYKYDLQGGIFYLDFDTPAESENIPTLIFTPKPVKSLTVDGKEIEYKSENGELTFTAGKGNHFVKLVMEKD